jgi:hypothetical protein
LDETDENSKNSLFHLAGSKPVRRKCAFFSENMSQTSYIAMSIFGTRHTPSERKGYVMYEPFILQCVERPQYELMKRGYEAYRSNTSPCQGGAANQCAVRMSIALGRAGFGLECFTPANRVHSGGTRCGTDGMKHVLGAEELARFLATALGAPTIIRPRPRHSGCAHAIDQIRGQTGIVYFNNCFTRAGATVRSGDHIDLFNGTQYYNQILHPAAGGNESTIGNLFGVADQVRFWALR